MDFSEEISFNQIYLKHLLAFLAEIKSRYFYKGFSSDETTNRILRNLLNFSHNNNSDLNWASLATTSDFYQIKNLTNFDSRNSEIVLLILQELKRLKKILDHENQGNNELNYNQIADFFLYRLEKNSFFDLHSSSNGSNSPLSGENMNPENEQNFNYKLNPLILYEENYNEMHNYNNFVKKATKHNSATGLNKRKKISNKHDKIEKIEKKKKCYEKHEKPEKPETEKNFKNENLKEKDNKTAIISQNLVFYIFFSVIY